MNMPDYQKVKKEKKKSFFLYTIYNQYSHCYTLFYTLYITSTATVTHFSHNFPATSTFDFWHHY